MLSAPVIHQRTPEPEGRASDFIALLETARPKQWIKNGFVLAAFLFAGAFTSWHGWRVSLSAFASFCLISSAIYMINDLADLEQDKIHPTKRLRPLPSGRLSPPWAIAGACAFTIISLGIAVSVNLALFAVVAGYGALMIAYTFYLKHQVILDVFTIAAGFVLRAVGGAVALRVPISSWLLVCSILLALFLALNKRRSELLVLQDEGKRHRKALDEYSLPLVEQMLNVVSPSILMSYSLYTFSAGRTPYMMTTIPVVLYGLFRYQYLVVRRGVGGSPEQVLLKDRPLQMTVILWVILSAAVLTFAGAAHPG